jgi:hypothetical protein
MPERALFATDLAATDAISLAHWERRALLVRIYELLAWMWAYWL